MPTLQIEILKIQGDIEDVASENLGEVAYKPPKVSYKKANIDITTSGQSGYSGSFNEATYNDWFGYLMRQIPGLFIARIPYKDYYAGDSAVGGKAWGLFHAGSGFPITTKWFQTRKAAHSCASRLTDVDWTQSFDELREDANAVKAINLLASCTEGYH